jgi:hypothetical protein
MAVITSDDQHFQRSAAREPIVGLDDKDISMQAAGSVWTVYVVEQDDGGLRCSRARISQAAFGDGMTGEPALFSVAGPRS